MIVNEIKTKELYMEHVKMQSKYVPKFMYNDGQLEIAETYLGVVFNAINRLDSDPFKQNQLYASAQATRVMVSVLNL